MQLDQQIRVNELLLQREELFLRIHAAETEITRLLRGPYPFSKPALPSDRRGKRKAAATVPGGPASAPAAPAASTQALRYSPQTPSLFALRRLGDDESAYRVTYVQFGREFVETHSDFSAVSTLLAAQAAHLRVLRIETLDAAGAPRATLFAAPAGA